MGVLVSGLFGGTITLGAELVLGDSAEFLSKLVTAIPDLAGIPLDLLLEGSYYPPS